MAIPGNDSEGGQLDSQSGASPVDWGAIQKRRIIYRVLFFAPLALAIAECFPGVSESGLAPLLLLISLLLGAAFFYYFLKTASLLGYPRTALLGILFLLFLPVANLCAAVILDRRMSAMIARRRLLSRPPTRTAALPDSVAGSPASVRLPVNRNAVAAFFLSLVFVPGLLVPPLVTAVERGAVNVPESIRMLVWQYGGVIWYSPIFFLIIGPASLLLAVKGTLQVQGRPKRQRGAGLAVASIVVVGMTYFGSVPLAMLLRQRSEQRTALCAHNVWTLTKAIVAYAHDHDGRFPEAGNWCDRIRSYLPGEDVFLCPAAPGVRCAYAFNAAVSTAMYDAIDTPDHTVAIFESDAGWNAAGGPELLPDHPRHLSGERYGFADGRTGWVLRKSLPDGTWVKEPNSDQVRWEPVLKDEPTPEPAGDG